MGIYLVCFFLTSPLFYWLLYAWACGQFCPTMLEGLCQVYGSESNLFGSLHPSPLDLFIGYPNLLFGIPWGGLDNLRFAGPNLQLDMFEAWEMVKGRTKPLIILLFLLLLLLFAYSSFPHLVCIRFSLLACGDLQYHLHLTPFLSFYDFFFRSLTISFFLQLTLFSRKFFSFLTNYFLLFFFYLVCETL